ncbi:MAG: type II secretion system secretin GspD [Pseudomonadota bacterium]
MSSLTGWIYHHLKQSIYAALPTGRLFLGFAFLLACLYGGTAGAGLALSAENAEADKYVTIDFNDVDIAVFIKYISELTGKNFVVDQRVKGKVTIISPSKISVAEAYKVFESVLEVHGFSTVDAGEITKVIPMPDARSKNIETKLRTEAKNPDDSVVTQLIPLKYANPDEIKALFAPLISKNSVMLSYAPTNMLIVTDVYSNILRLMKILTAIDISGMGQEISVIPVQNADAEKIVKLLATVFKPQVQGKKKGTADDAITVVADDRTNYIVLMASQIESERVRDLIQMLDKELPRGKENFHVRYLEHATAEDLAKVIQALPTTGTADEKGGKTTTPAVSDKVKITPDKATNSLIIMADKEEFQILEGIIAKLDIPRAMVYIESLIIEVNVDKDFQLGAEWAVGGEGAYGNKRIGYGGGSGNGGAINNVILGGDATKGFTFPSGMALGVFGEGITIGSVFFPSIAAVVKAFQQDKDVHILSTPQILTTDNEEASISVGKNVPFQTSTSFSTTTTTGSFEYKDVGIMLKITPQISKDRMVRLKIEQESTKIDELATKDLTTDNRVTPTTFKRTVQTTVIVKDNNTVVIGGLIDDSFTNTVTKVPCLGDVPIVGWAFRSESNSGEKTNLFIFITPRVIQSPTEATAVFEQKKDAMKEIEGGRIKMYMPRSGNSVPVPETILPPATN